MMDFNSSNGQEFEHLAAFNLLDRDAKAAVEPLLPLIRQMELTNLDYMTIRDLIELSDCGGDIPLVIVLMVMFAGLRDGNLCLNLDQDQFTSYLAADQRKAAETILADFLSGLAADRYQKLVATDAADYLPLIRDVSTGADLLYFQKYHLHETRLKNRIEALLTAPASLMLPEDRINALIEEIYADRLAIRVGQSATPIAKDPVQLEAIRLALGSQFSIISGGPGTGKTSLMVNILRCLVRENTPESRIVLGAPTGRAAQRMTETLQNNVASIQKPSADDLKLMDLKGSTLHKILGYRRYQNDFYYGRTNPLPVSVVVIDEVSMVDIVMMDKFLQAVDPEQTKLIFLGDKNQLPSVEAGSVLAEMIPNGDRAVKFSQHFVVLKTVYRSGTNLLKLASQANRGGFPSIKAVSFATALSLEEDQWAFVQAQGFGPWQAHLDQWLQAHYLNPFPGSNESYATLISSTAEMPPERITASAAGLSRLSRIFSVVDRARILTILRSGPYGCTVVNDVIAARLMLVLDPAADRRADVFSGAVVIITRNDYSKELFNGDVGVIIKGADDTYRAYFQRSGSYISYPVNLLPSWEFAFAITVHKSQGSEFDDVLLVLPDDENHRLLTREIVYTGITRAKKRVLLYGSQPALDSALQKTINRQSGLMW